MKYLILLFFSILIPSSSYGETCYLDKNDVSYITCDGQALITYNHGGVYMGEWDIHRQCHHGLGQLTFPNGDVYYGNHECNVFEGYGELTFANGNIYKGNFSKDAQHGEGIMIYENKEFRAVHEYGVLIESELMSDVIEKEKNLAKQKQQQIEEEKMNLAASRCIEFGFKIDDDGYPQCMMTMMVEEEKRSQEKLANEIKLAEMELRIAELESENKKAQNERERLNKARAEMQMKKEQEAWINLIIAESRQAEKQRNTNFWLNLAASDPVQPGESFIQTMADVLSTGEPSRNQSNSYNYSQSRCKWVLNHWICDTYQ